MTLNEALNMISGMNAAELSTLNEAVCLEIRSKRNQDARNKRFLLSTGDKVSWTGRRGFTQGNIVRIKRKKAIVNVIDSGNWDVPLSMLSAV